MSDKQLHVIGGGMAGSEAAWQAAEMGVSVTLHEMRPVRKTDVHQTDQLAELVCSNSFRSDDATANAVGVLHAEMRMLNSVIMAEAGKARVPAGEAGLDVRPRRVDLQPRGQRQERDDHHARRLD